ncbi:MAG: CBS domain-containing protein [Candidatus Aenigmarchaeota archaeon]|nr:CBS domain-containing protein [Candidatus Aenigmarchaeota archaeon]
MKVADVMSRRVVALKPSHTLHDALKLFAANRISGCPVTSRGKLVGVLSQSDIIALIDVHAKIQKETTSLVLAALVSEKYDALKPAIRKLLNHEVRRYMQGNVVTISSGDDLYEAAKLMNKHKIERLPVVDGMRPVGIISKSDIARALGE